MATPINRANPAGFAAIITESRPSAPANTVITATSPTLARAAGYRARKRNPQSDQTSRYGQEDGN